MHCQCYRQNPDDQIQKLLRQLNQTQDPLDALALYFQLTRARGHQTERPIWLVLHRANPVVNRSPAVTAHLTEEGAAEYAASVIISTLEKYIQNLQGVGFGWREEADTVQAMKLLYDEGKFTQALQVWHNEFPYGGRFVRDELEIRKMNLRP